MINKIIIKNCFAFDEYVFFSAEDQREKKFTIKDFFKSNKNENKLPSIFKSVGIFAPNNAGKTSFIKCIKAIKKILLSQKPILAPNMFLKDPVCEFTIIFTEEGRKFYLCFKYNTIDKRFVYQELCEITKDGVKDIYTKDDPNQRYIGTDEGLAEALESSSNRKLALHTIGTKKFPVLDEAKRLIIQFAEKIDIIDMGDISLTDVVEFMTTDNRLKCALTEFVNYLDLGFQNLSYNEELLPTDPKELEKCTVREKCELQMLSLTARHHFEEFPIYLLESKGAQRIISYAAYVLRAILEGRTLIIDGIENDIHTTINKQIINAFNLKENTGGQLIFTTKDILLMDCEKVFVPEQIWFIGSDGWSKKMYRLSDVEDSKITNAKILKKYLSGKYGACHKPHVKFFFNFKKI